MAKHWTKIRSDVVTSTRMAALLDARGPAYGLYIQAKAVCDDYGRLPAEPRKFKALAAPMSELSVNEVADALDLMEQIGVTRRYQVDGETYMEIAAYNEIEDTYWLNVGRPEYPAPPDWTPPATLIEFLASNLGKSGIFAERYGMTDAQANALTANHMQRTCKAPAAQAGSTCSAPAKHLRRRCAAKTESETESETEEDGLSRARARGGPRTAPPALSEQEHGDGARPTALAHQVRSAARSFYGTTEPPGGWERNEQQMAEQLAIAGDRLTPQDVAAAFDIESPLRPRPGEWADKFLCRLIAERERASPEQDDAEIETGRKRAALGLQLERAHQAGDEEMIRSIEERLAAL